MSIVRRESWIAAALVVLVVAIYARVLGHEFLNHDDPEYVFENPVVKKGLTVAGVKWAFRKLHGEHTYWHPLTWLSHMADVQLFGVKPGAHHLVNVFFHATNAVLLFLLLQQLTGAMWRSAMAAALFALHPLQVDTVAWIAERKNLLAGMFWILTTMVYVRYVRTGKWAGYGLLIMLFALGLMCKPALVTLPCVLLLLDYWPLGRIKNHIHIYRLFVEKLPLFVLSAISSVITVAAHAGLGMTQNIHGYSLQLRIENAIVSYARYLKKVFWPSDLAIAYPHPGQWRAVTVWGSALLLVAITCVALLYRKQRPYLLIGWCWFLGVLFPAIGILQVGMQAMADRFAYIPVIGVFLMIAWGFAEWAAKRQVWLPRLAAASAVLACMVATSLQLPHWKSSETVFEHALSVTGDNYVAHHNLSVDYAARGRTNEAWVHATEALRIQPRASAPLLILAQLCEWRNDLPCAISNYERFLRIAPNRHQARDSLAFNYLKQGNLDAARAEFLKVIELAPADSDAYRGLAEVHATLHQTGTAISYYRKALESAPDSVGVLNNLAWLLATCSETQFRDATHAVQYAEHACEVTGHKASFALGTLAAAYAEAGRFPDAVRTAEEARALALKEGNTNIAEANAKLLKYYRASRPFHEGDKN